MPESKADKLTAVLAAGARYGSELDSALRTMVKLYPPMFVSNGF